MTFIYFSILVCSKHEQKLYIQKEHKIKIQNGIIIPFGRETVSTKLVDFLLGLTLHHGHRQYNDLRQGRGNEVC